MAALDLTKADDYGVRPWTGGVEALKTHAAQANLRHAAVDLSKAHDRATLFKTLDAALKLPEHFGHNFDALADVLEDRDWLGKRGVAIALLGFLQAATRAPRLEVSARGLRVVGQ